MDEVFGNFNDALRNKMILQLDEAHGKQGFDRKDRIKNLSTTKTLNINSKGRPMYETASYLRIFIFTNNINPVEIPHGDRRYIVFRASTQKPDRQYYDTLASTLSDEDGLYTLFEYFRKRDITTFIPSKNRPITEAYEQMRDNNIHPFYKLLKKLFIDDDIENHFADGEFKEHSNTGNILIQARHLITAYQAFCRSERIEDRQMNTKVMRGLLDDVGVRKRAFKIQGRVNDYNEFNLDDLMPLLEERVPAGGMEELADDEVIERHAIRET